MKKEIKIPIYKEGGWGKAGDMAGNKFTMFMKDMEKIIIGVGIEPGGVIKGMWQAVKRGANYGIQLVEEYE